MVILTTFICLLILFIIWLNWRKRLMTKLERNGIPGPKPHLIFGNLHEYHTKGYAKCHEDWIKQYGRIVGYYLGGKPFVLVADPDLLKLIQIKDFYLFVHRPMTVSDGVSANPRLLHSLIRVNEQRWKQQRSILTPTFSSAKLRQMTPIIDSSVEKFLSKIGEKSASNDEFDIFELLQGLTMDTIAKAAFGVEFGVQDDLNNPFLNASRGVFNAKIGQKLITLWFCFPELRFIIRPLRTLLELIKDSIKLSNHAFMFKICDQVLDERRRNPRKDKCKDLLQLMIESKSEVLSNEKLTVNNDMSIDSAISEANQDSIKKISMTDDEISSNSTLFFDAGYETTSTALSYIMHILVNHEHIQERIRDEVKLLINNEGVLDYNTVTKLSFMEQVVYETMRIYPPVTTFISRSPKVDYSYKNIVIPKGTDCRVPVYYLHHDSELWNDSEQFRPERFEDKSNNLVNSVIWQPFGCGPRNCVGIRFALLEIKLLVAKLLLKYKLVPGPNTELGDIKRDFKLVTMCPKNGVFVKAISLSD